MSNSDRAQDDSDKPADDQDQELPHRHGHGRREEDDLIRNVQKSWRVVSAMLAAMLALLLYIHNTEVSQIKDLQAGDMEIAKQRSVNLQRLAIVEERTVRLEKAMVGQDAKLDEILRLQQEVNRGRR